MSPHIAPPAPTVFQTELWLRALERGFGFETVRIGPVPLTPRDDLVGRRVIGLPFADYLVAGDVSGTLAAIVGAFPAHAAQVKLAGSPVEGLPEGWSVGRLAVRHDLDASDGEAALARASSAFRRNLRKAHAAGVKVSVATDPDAIDRFHALFAEHRRRKFGILTHPRGFLRALADEFFPAGRGFVLEAHVGDRLAAAYLALIHDGVLIYKFGASDMDALEARPNDRLMAELMIRAPELGCQRIDLGLSWLGGAEGEDGILRFKDGLGAVRLPVTEYIRPASAVDAEKTERARRILRWLTELAVKDPMSADLADSLGESLFRYFT